MKKLLLITSFIFINEILFAQGTNTPCVLGVPAATVLTPSGSCSPVAGTTVGAGYNNNAANGGTPSCASPGENDVWFRFVAPAGGNVTIDLGANSMTDSGMSLYSGTCGAFVELVCDDDGGAGLMSQITSGALTPGTTYYIRVWSFMGDGPGTFTICVIDNGGGGGAPANDDPCSATALTVGASCSFTASTNANATASAGVPAPGCANYAGGDVWFTVTVPASGNLIFDSNTGFITDSGMAIYTGTCGSLTLVACDDDGSTNGAMSMINAGGLTPGATIWIRFWEYGNNGNGTFSICAYDPGGGPANDNPCSATAITAGATCSFSIYTNANATASAGVPAPGCSSYAGGDVWFTVTVPASGHLIFDSNTGVITDGGMAIYSGACGSLTLIECDDDNSNNGAMPMINNSSLTPGATIWIRFWEYGNDNNGTFSLCVYDGFVNLPGANCTNAINIASLPFTSTGLTTCGFGDDFDSGDACGSGYMNGDDFVYTYTPATNQSIDVTLTNTTTWVGVFITQGCPGNPASPCVANNTNSAGNPSVQCVPLTGGVTYYITISTNPTPQCTPFDIAVIPSAATLPSCNLAYTLSSIASSTTGGGGWTSLTFTDDRFADSYTNIGFDFCFDNAFYTQTLVSSNGYIIFPSCYTVVPGGTATPTGYSPWQINAAIPNTTDAPRNAILLTWQDIDPSVTGTIRYKTTGTAPNRIFILQYSNVAMFQASCNSLKFNGEIRLYETSNNIEFAIVEKTLCTTWNSGAAIQGLHNYAGTIAVVPAGRNYPTQWSETNIGYRFTPTCACTNPLAISDIDLQVTPEINYNHLVWTVPDNNQISQFQVEKSLNAADFFPLGNVELSQRNATNKYEYADIETNECYYRIKGIDVNGKFVYSSVIRSGSTDLRMENLWPNPHDLSFNITLTASYEQEIIGEIADMTGRVIKTIQFSLEKGSATFEIPTSDFASGFYYLQLKNKANNTVSSHSFVKN